MIPRARGAAVIMRTAMSPLRPLSSRIPHPRAWLWAMVALLLLKAAVPLLAIAAAHGQNVALVEVCSVYGVRTVPVDAPAEPAAPHASADSHCTLASLLGPWAPVPMAALPPLPAAQTAAAPRVAPGHAAPVDASQRWLTARLHAPPLTA